MTDLDDYIESHSTLPEGTRYELFRKTNLTRINPRMMSSQVQGKLLEMLCSMIKPTNALEIGAFTGYATLNIASGLPKNGHLYSIEISDENEEIIKEHLSKAQLNDIVTLIIGDAKNIIPTLNTTFDFVFIDADKRNNDLYYDLVFEKVNHGGYMLIDNTLWSGKVTDPTAQDRDTQCIRAFNNKVQADNRVENIILPIRDGLTIVKKI